MTSHRLAFKFFFSNPDQVDRERLVPMFHLWIRDQGLTGHQLIDVADYSHVKTGPGVVLVSHEANITIDDSDQKLGLLYQRKRPFGTTSQDRLKTTLFSTLEACLKLEHDPTLGGHVQFLTDSFLFKIEDRLLAPNTRATFDQVWPALKPIVQRLYDTDKIEATQTGDEQAAFQLLIQTGTKRPIADLEDRTGLAAEV